MENASKALIIAAEVLLGVILLTLMVFLFRAMGAFSSAVDQNIETNNVNEFNVTLEKYRDKSDITAQDIITMGNYAKQYNEKMEKIQLEVIVQGVASKYTNVHMLNTDKNEQYEFIKEYSNNRTTNEIIYFKCIEMNYDEETGRINKIILKIVN